MRFLATFPFNKRETRQWTYLTINLALTLNQIKQELSCAYFMSILLDEYIALSQSSASEGMYHTLLSHN